MYLPLDEWQRQEFKQLIAIEPYKGVQAVNQTVFEKGIEKGRREVLREFLEDRFGPLPTPAKERLEQWPVERLADLAKACVKAQSLRELGLED